MCYNYIYCSVGFPGGISGLGRSPGEGNGNPLQYSCLKNPMDREAWWAAVHGVARVRHNRATKYMLSIFLDSCLEIRSQCRGHPLSLRTSQIRKQASHIPKHWVIGCQRPKDKNKGVTCNLKEKASILRKRRRQAWLPRDCGILN